MTLDEIESTLPWGLHDAYVERLAVDWTTSTAQLYVRVMMSEQQDLDRRARLDITGLLYVSMEARDPATLAGRPATPDGLWVQPERRDPLDAGGEHFVHEFFVSSWNRSFTICARDAALVWEEPAAVPARAATRARFPGEHV